MPRQPSRNSWSAFLRCSSYTLAVQYVVMSALARGVAVISTLGNRFYSQTDGRLGWFQSWCGSKVHSTYQILIHALIKLAPRRTRLTLAIDRSTSMSSMSQESDIGCGTEEGQYSFSSQNMRRISESVLRNLRPSQ